MKKALIIIDYNNDFVADNGKLTCGKLAQEIDNNIAKVVTKFSESGDFIFNACDTHAENEIYSPEAKMFPVHCVAGSSRM